MIDSDTANLTRDLVTMFQAGEPEAAIGRLARFATRKAQDPLVTAQEADRWARLAVALERVDASMDERQTHLPLEEDQEPPSGP